jgi:hypothetical protein
MKTDVKILTVILAIIFLSCNKSSKKNENKMVSGVANYEEPYNDKKLMKALLDSAIVYGDESSYKTAYKNYIISNHYGEFLYYSIIMAEKHDYSQAFYDSYYLLKSDYMKKGDGKKDIPDLANFFLLKAYEKGNQDAIDDVEEMYPDIKSIPKASYYLDKMNKQ